jgi:hypothetical protein
MAQTRILSWTGILKRSDIRHWKIQGNRKNADKEQSPVHGHHGCLRLIYARWFLLWGNQNPSTTTSKTPQTTLIYGRCSSPLSHSFKRSSISVHGESSDPDIRTLLELRGPRTKRSVNQVHVWIFVLWPTAHIKLYSGTELDSLIISRNGWFVDLRRLFHCMASSNHAQREIPNIQIFLQSQTNFQRLVSGENNSLRP